MADSCDSSQLSGFYISFSAAAASAVVVVRAVAALMQSNMNGERFKCIMRCIVSHRRRRHDQIKDYDQNDPITISCAISFLTLSISFLSISFEYYFSISIERTQ